MAPSRFARWHFDLIRLQLIADVRPQISLLGGRKVSCESVAKTDCYAFPLPAYSRSSLAQEPPLRLTSCAVALIGMIALGACQSPAPSFTQEDEAAIKAMADSVPGLFLARSFEPWANQWTADAVLQAPNAPAAKGREARLAFANGFPALDQVAFRNFILHGEGNLAWATIDYTLTIKGAPPDSGKQLVVFQRQSDGKWKAVAGSFSSDVPLPTTTAPAK